MSRLCAVLLLFTLLAAGCARPAAKVVHPSPTPARSASPSPSLRATVKPPAAKTPAATPEVNATPRPTVAPSPVPTDPPPRIVGVSLSEHVVHSGDTVFEHVRTSPNTASVEARIGGYSMTIPKTGVGEFSGSYKVPWLPFFIHGNVDLVMIARNTEGVQARRVVRINVQ